MLLSASCAPSPRLATMPSLATRQWQDDRAGEQTAPRKAFWHAFGAPGLEQLLRQADAQNPALDVARARVDRARAELGIASASRLPTVDANLGFESSHAHQSASPVYTYNGASAGLDIGYDLDLFGANRAARRASRDRLGASAFDAEAVRLVTDAQVARSYVLLCLLDERVSLARQQLAGARQLAAIIGSRSREGAAGQAEVNAAAANVAGYADRLASFVEQQRHARVALAILVGEEPAVFVTTTLPVSALQVPALDPGQPAELLTRRPDIRAAEARIAAARGDVDAARRAFLPSLKISGSLLGSSAGFLGPLGLTSSVGSSLIAPIFEGGRLRGQLEVASAGQRESVALYRQSLLAALGEVSDALIAVDASRDRAGRTVATMAGATRQLGLSKARLAEGEIGVDTLIDAQIDHDAAADAGLLAKADRLNAAIDLFRATGGAPQASGETAEIARSR
jgi:NodT family efflux transporter outer membrane factor (OMF) lipoprotein